LGLAVQLGQLLRVSERLIGSMLEHNGVSGEDLMAAVNVGGRTLAPQGGRWGRLWGHAGGRAALLLPSLTALVAVAVLVSVGRGAVAISPAQVVAILLGGLYNDDMTPVVEWLRDTPVSHLNQKLPMPYTDFPYATMNWIIYHVMEQEIHHRGQIFMLMRLQGLTPPELQRSIYQPPA